MQDQLRQAIASHGKGTVAQPDRVRLGDHLRRRLEEVARPTIRPKTYISYRQLIGNHLVPGLGKVRLQRLEPDQVQRFPLERHQSGLSPRTGGCIRAVLSRALNQALNTHTALSLQRAGFTCWGGVQLFSPSDAITPGRANSGFKTEEVQEQASWPWPGDFRERLGRRAEVVEHVGPVQGRERRALHGIAFRVHDGHGIALPPNHTA